LSDESEEEEENDEETASVKKLDERKFILDLFNDGSIEEIKSFTETQSAIKLENLLSMRPFRDYDDLKKKSDAIRVEYFLKSAEKLMFARNQVNTLMSKCQAISSQMKKLEKLTQHKYETDDLKVLQLGLVKQPKILNKS
jgi:hypothetical protein